jgi:nucleotide-binding universal stress UspA family protein
LAGGRRGLDELSHSCCTGVIAQQGRARYDATAVRCTVCLALQLTVGVLEGGPMFKHILVPLDGSKLAECVLPHVVAVANAFEADVTLLQVLERERAPSEQGFVDPLGWYMGSAEAQAYLDGIAARIQELGLRAETAVREGRAAQQIIGFARRKEADLLVLSSHGRSGLSGWNVSGVVQKTIMRAYVPVMIVRAYQPVSADLDGVRYGRIVIPLDGSRRAECVLPLATTIARSHGSELMLVHVMREVKIPYLGAPRPEDDELVQQVMNRAKAEASNYLDRLKPRVDARAQTYLLVGDSAACALHELIEQKDASLVILSAHGYSGTTKWPYGSMVINLIGYGTTPLLIVQDLRPEEVERSQAEVIAREQGGH